MYYPSEVASNARVDQCTVLLAWQATQQCTNVLSFRDGKQRNSGPVYYLSEMASVATIDQCIILLT